MKEQNIVLVDIFDNKIGACGKQVAHKTGKLHRAFSVFLYHKNLMLIQKRALHKYHSSGLWSNACCSHPPENQTLTDFVKKRLYEEMQIDCPVQEVFHFTYFHKFNDELFEYEYDHVFLGEYKGNFRLNPEEAAEAKWMNLDDLERMMIEQPELFTVWFLIAAPKVMRIIKKKYLETCNLIGG
ncbi:MAG: NUDIX domain-containing protein [Bacilli bacterium]|nr:NUDIX domain-containing protein [Bacilli bacterium]